MPDFIQTGTITTLHDLGCATDVDVERLLLRATRNYHIGLVLPVTAADMQEEPFSQIIARLVGAEFIDTAVIVLNRTDSPDDFRQCHDRVGPLGPKGHVLWTDGLRVQALYRELISAGFNVSVPGKGRAVWTAFGFLLADPLLQAFALHDCDIVNYDRTMLIRLCLPMAHPSLDFDFCKAYYARCTDRMHGRVVRLLMTPLLRALISVAGPDDFLVYLNSFRYPLAGEFAITATLARSNRTPSDWGLEVGTLAEVFRNTSTKRVCQVDLGSYEHKHQDLSLEDPQRGLMKMTGDILSNVVRTLASRGMVFQRGHFLTLRSAYLRTAQDAIRQYHADALINGLEFDRHEEERAVEGFAEQITAMGERFYVEPSETLAMPTWSRVLAALPDLPHRLRQAATEDAKELVRG